MNGRKGKYRNSPFSTINCPLSNMHMYVYVYVVWRAATAATMLMVNDLTRYKAATLPLHIRYIFCLSARQRVDCTQWVLLKCIHLDGFPARSPF